MRVRILINNLSNMAHVTERGNKKMHKINRNYLTLNALLQNIYK